MRYELSDDEWTAIKPVLPNKPRGVPRVNDRRVLNGIFWVLRHAKVIHALWQSSNSGSAVTSLMAASQLVRRRLQAARA